MEDRRWNCMPRHPPSSLRFQDETICDWCRVPHPARRDGARDAQLKAQLQDLADPIRLVRMVDQMVGLHSESLGQAGRQSSRCGFLRVRNGILSARMVRAASRRTAQELLGRFARSHSSQLAERLSDRSLPRDTWALRMTAICLENHEFGLIAL